MRERACTVPYSRFLLREKTFANCLKIDFRGENLREFAVTQCTTSTSAVSNCLKIDFRRENFSKSPQKRKIRERFLPRKKPAIGYILCRKGKSLSVVLLPEGITSSTPTLHHQLQLHKGDSPSTLSLHH